MTTSENIGALAAALAKAQGQMKNATLNKTVKTDKYTFRFADLPQVRDTVTPALTANGIAVVQVIDGDTVVTRLIHDSGEWVESVCPIPHGQTMQALGSAITYARRYSLSAICGISSEEDDDGGASTAALPAFNEADETEYLEWCENLKISAPTCTFKEFTDLANTGKPAHVKRLTANKPAWSMLTSRVKDAKKAVPA